MLHKNYCYGVFFKFVTTKFTDYSFKTKKTLQLNLVYSKFKIRVTIMMVTKILPVPLMISA